MYMCNVLRVAAAAYIIVFFEMVLLCAMSYARLVENALLFVDI